MPILVIFLLLASATATLTSGGGGMFECNSCVTSCRTSADGHLDPHSCDCTSSNNGNATADVMATCTGASCFVKVEFFPEESMAIVQKGCAQGLPAGVSGCNFAGQLESIHCYCQGPLCNTREQLSDYTPQALPTVDCCDCSQPGGDRCPEQECARTCKGNYCLIDFDGVEQGCGMGVPRLQSFLRIPNYTESLKQGELTCARYQATETTSVHGCVCTATATANQTEELELSFNTSSPAIAPSMMCNQLNQSRQHQLDRVIGRREDDLTYCYSLHQRSDDHPFNKDIFKESDTCEGHYCFVSLSTVEMLVEAHNTSIGNDTLVEEYVGVAKPKYEILAGCLKVDDDKKVTPGCTTEYMHSSGSPPISRHCICDTHLCNYWNMLQFNFTAAGEVAEPKSSPILNDDDDDEGEGDGPTSSAPSLIFKPLQVVGVLLFIVVVGWEGLHH